MSRQIVSAEELASILGIHPDTVRRMARDRQIPALLVGKRLRFEVQAVLDALRASPQEGAADDADEGTT